MEVTFNVVPCFDSQLKELLTSDVLGLRTVPYHTVWVRRLLPNAEVCSGPSAHPHINREVKTPLGYQLPLSNSKRIIYLTVIMLQAS